MVIIDDTGERIEVTEKAGHIVEMSAAYDSLTFVLGLKLQAALITNGLPLILDTLRAGIPNVRLVLHEVMNVSARRFYSVCLSHACLIVETTTAVMQNVKSSQLIWLIVETGGTELIDALDMFRRLSPEIVEIANRDDSMIPLQSLNVDLEEYIRFLKTGVL